jgi:hypothetical protein
LRIDVKALAVTAALIWGITLLLVGSAHMVRPHFGSEFLSVVASVYPGYQASGSFRDLAVGIGYGLVDGALFGLVFGWLYNRLAGGRTKRIPVQTDENQKPLEP